MDFFNIITTLVSFALVYALVSIPGKIRTRDNRRRLAPGPTPWPIIGNLPSIGSKPHRSFASLANSYGPIMRLQLGCITTVVISSPSVAKEALQKHDLAFSSRTIPEAARACDHHLFSVGSFPASSTTWRTLRKIMNSNIFNIQKLDSSLQLRQQKVKELVYDVQRSCMDGIPVNIGEASFRVTMNLLSNTILSMDLADSSSNSAGRLKDLMIKIMVEFGKPNLGNYFPVLRMLDPQGIRRRLTVYFGNLIALFSRIIDERIESRQLQPCKSSKDVLDTLLDFIKDSSCEINRNHVEHLLVDLFAAGVDTVASTVEWAMAELVKNPEKLSNAQDEMMQIIGRGKPIEESDLTRLPYLQAIVKETFRLHPTVPLLLPHKANEDVELCGFTVPKDAQVLFNVWAIGQDPNLWENPHLFLPERFLGSKIDVKGQDFELIPFGAGRRICPGLPLGIRMVYLILGSLINSFDWKTADGVKADEINMEERFGIGLTMAQPLHLIPINARD